MAVIPDRLLPHGVPESTITHLPAVLVGSPQWPLTKPTASGAAIESAPFHRCQLLFVESKPICPLAEVVNPAATLNFVLVAPLKSTAPVADSVPVKVGLASGAFAPNCVWMLEVGSTKPIVVGVTPSSVLFVSVCVSVVPTIVPVGAATEDVRVVEDPAIGI